PEERTKLLEEPVTRRHLDTPGPEPRSAFPPRLPVPLPPRRRAPLHEDRRRARARPEGERRLRDRLRVAGEERQLEPDEAAVPDPLQRVDLVQEERRRILVTVPARYGPHQEDRA